MEKNEEKIKILIDWYGPYSYMDIINNNIQNENFFVKPTDKGLYQIYSSHPLYGDNVLTYIGKTETSFQQRLKEREIITFNKDTHNVQIYLGVIYFDDIFVKIDKTCISKYIAYAETLLINYHAPANNSQSINRYKDWDKDITVINRGSYRMLQHEISTVGLFQDEQAYAELEKLKEKINKNAKWDEDNTYLGFYINEKEDLWLGFVYDLWKNEIMLVLESSKKINSEFIIQHKEQYYKPIYGTAEEIIATVESYK